MTSPAFAQTLEALMTRSNVQQVTLARALGVAPSAVANYRKGRVPRAEVLEKIASFFSVSIDSLLGFKPEGRVTVFPSAPLQVFDPNKHGRRLTSVDMRKLEQLKSSMAKVKEQHDFLGELMKRLADHIEEVEQRFRRYYQASAAD